ncbi:MAG: hypothetical protein GTO41_20620 [Burkholderiales bacterium]|nr:hypothetical protein [Burkholderiales bacterium]
MMSHHMMGGYGMMNPNMMGGHGMINPQMMGGHRMMGPYMMQHYGMMGPGMMFGPCAGGYMTGHGMISLHVMQELMREHMMTMHSGGGKHMKGMHQRMRKNMRDNE